MFGGNDIPVALFYLIYTSIISAAVLAMAVLHKGTTTPKRILFYLVAIPALIGISMLFLAIIPHAKYGYSFFTTFITCLWLYLKAARLLRNYQENKRK